MVCETRNFPHLSYGLVARILSSSSLHVTCELEVYYATDLWLCFDEKRSRFARRLLPNVRLCLLSDAFLACLLDYYVNSSKFDGCATILRNAIRSKRRDRLTAAPPRYCDQNSFNMLVGGGDDNPNAREINYAGKISATSQLGRARVRARAVCLRGEVFLFGGSDERDFVSSVEAYSIFTKKWRRVADMGARHVSFCACALVDKVYICAGKMRAGRLGWDRSTDVCKMFSTRDYSWKEVARMRSKRSNAACSAFQGRMVVCGGTWEGRSVEAYDPTVDHWYEMPSMAEGKADLSSVAVKNKLFVIGRSSSVNVSCEVFDAVAGGFALISMPKSWSPVRIEHGGVNVGVYLDRDFQAVSVGNSVVVYDSEIEGCSCYDIERDEWSREAFTQFPQYFFCVKVPELLEY